jgi:hypothetical protein
MNYPTASYGVVHWVLTNPLKLTETGIWDIVKIISSRGHRGTPEE